MIRITRGTTQRDRRVAYKIFIDGTYCGLIRENETKGFEAKEGTHTVWAKIDWCRSNKLSVDIKDSVVELEVGGTEKGDVTAAPEHNLLYSILFWNKYLWLREKESAGAPPEDVK